jgi:hypothetical protein
MSYENVSSSINDDASGSLRSMGINPKDKANIAAIERAVMNARNNKPKEKGIDWRLITPTAEAGQERVWGIVLMHNLEAAKINAALDDDNALNEYDHRHS